MGLETNVLMFENLTAHFLFYCAHWQTYVSGTLKFGLWVYFWDSKVWQVSIYIYNIYYLRNTHVWQRVCLWNAKNLANEYVSWMFMFGKWVCLGTGSAQVWQVNLSLECSSLASTSLKCSSLASEFVSGMLKFGKWICLWNAQVWQVRLWNGQVWQVSMAQKHSSLAHEWVRVELLNDQVWQVTVILLPMM